MPMTDDTPLVLCKVQVADVMYKVLSDLQEDSVVWQGMLHGWQMAMAIAKPIAEPIKRYLQNFSKDKAYKVGNSEVKLMTGACGSGKTLFAPPAIAQEYGFKNVVVFIPRRMAVDNAYKYYTEKHLVRAFQNGRAYGNTKGRPTYILSTYGMALGLFKKNLLKFDDDTIFFMDEVHDITPEMELTYSMLVRNKARIVLMSATIPFMNFPSLKKHEMHYWFSVNYIDIKSETKVGSSQVRSQAEKNIKPAKDFINETIYDSDRVFCIVGPSLSVARMAYQDSFPFSIDIVIGVSSKSLFLDVGAHNVEKYDFPDVEKMTAWILEVYKDKRIMILATPVIEVGVTIPALDHVIDLGTRYNLEVQEYMLSSNVLNENNIARAVMRPATYGEVVQVAGRVGRTHPGTAVLFGAWNYREVSSTWGSKILTDALCVKKNINRVYGTSPAKITDVMMNEIKQWHKDHPQHVMQGEDKRALWALMTQVQQVAEACRLLEGKPDSYTRTTGIMDVCKGIVSGKQEFKEAFSIMHTPRPSSPGLNAPSMPITLVHWGSATDVQSETDEPDLPSLDDWFVRDLGVPSVKTAKPLENGDKYISTSSVVDWLLYEFDGKMTGLRMVLKTTIGDNVRMVSATTSPLALKGRNSAVVSVKTGFAD